MGRRTDAALEAIAAHTSWPYWIAAINAFFAGLSIATGLNSDPGPGRDFQFLVAGLQIGFGMFTITHALLAPRLSRAMRDHMHRQMHEIAEGAFNEVAARHSAADSESVRRALFPQLPSQH